MLIALSPCRPRRVLLALVAATAAFVGAQTATLAHQAAVLHVVCAEHGTTIELDGHADAAAVRAPAPEAGVRSATGDLDHDHDCDFVALLRQGQGAPSATASPAVALVAAPVGPTQPAFVPAAAVAPWRLAPKQSPPIVA